jgi:hypothetical protein
MAHPSSGPGESRRAARLRLEPLPHVDHSDRHADGAAAEASVGRLLLYWLIQILAMTAQIASPEQRFRSLR